MINDQLDDLRYYYGKAEIKNKGNAYKYKGKETTRVSKDGVKAQRAEYNALYYKTKSNAKQYELLSDLASANVRLDSLSQSDLPDELKHLSKDSLAIVVKQKMITRDSLQKRLQTAIVKRKEYIDAELAKKK